MTELEHTNTTPEAHAQAHETFFNIVRVYERFWSQTSRFLKDHDLTMQQYQVAQILAGSSSKEGLPSLVVAQRMLNRVPDITRLLDRMERRGLVNRARSLKDRRVVLVRLSAAGRSLVDELDEPIRAFHRECFDHMSSDELCRLNQLLLQAQGA